MRTLLTALLLPLALVGRPEPETIPTPPVVESNSGKTEAYYTEQLAKRMGALSEVRLWDGVRADLEDETRIYEIDWANKKFEAIGQALLYAQYSGKKPVIILLVKHRVSEMKELYRAHVVAARCGVEVRLEFINEEKWK